MKRTLSLLLALILLLPGCGKKEDVTTGQDAGTIARVILAYLDESRDADALTAAMQEYAGKKVRRIQRPSVLQRLAQLRSQVKKPSIDREKRKEQVR